MARLPRRDSGTGYFHVVVRGNNREFVFELNRQKRSYDNLLRKYQTEFNMELASWCYMNNHVHLLIGGSSVDLSKYMKMVNQKFTCRYHRGHSTSGHIFQGRYYCSPIDDRVYLRCVIRYIHNNPVSAGIVKKSHEYSWSSYNDFLKTNRDKNLEKVFDLFKTIDNYIEYHKEYDFNNYSDNKEDVQRYRSQIIERIKKKYLIRNDISSLDKIIENSELKRKLVLALSELSWISNKEISVITKIPMYSVRKIRNELFER